MSFKTIIFSGTKTQNYIWILSKFAELEYEIEKQTPNKISTDFSHSNGIEQVYENRTERWKAGCGISHSNGFSYSNSEWKTKQNLTTEFEQVCGIKIGIWNLIAHSFFEFFFWVLKKEKQKTTTCNTVYKKLLILGLNKGCCVFAYFWFSCGKSSHTKPQLSIH